MKKALFICAMSLIMASATPAFSQSKVCKEMTDSLSVRMYERTGYKHELVLKKVTKRGTTIDLHFDQSLSDFPWRKQDIEWFRAQVKENLPKEYKGLELGNILAKSTDLEELVTPELGNTGRASVYSHTYKDRDLSSRFVTRIGEDNYSKGLSGRNIALWQSHGLYFDSGANRWKWQRPMLHRTVEDMYTQSYVLQFLIPMLENAGAYVMTPRERDIQRNEIITDNDPSFEGERPLPMRQCGKYSESGSWKGGGTGFADTKPVYLIDENPFISGTARTASCTSADKATASASWAFDIPQDGEYAVYVSYASLPNSSRCARYTVSHAGGKTQFVVNQKMGAGTWVYLGTFNFVGTGKVVLDNGTPAGYNYASGSAVSADAVKIGGGMGKTARARAKADSAEFVISGMPSYAEGALYSMQWAGIDSTVTGKWDGDYTRDFASRGAWVRKLSGGSRVNPKEEGKKIPVDLSLGVHSDAGLFPNDSLIGTLAIYTLLCENSQDLPDGKDRIINRHYADLVQSQICNDLRASFDTAWARRGLFDRSYSESRTSGVPALLIEMLSHQNFADMRYGLDPSFRFTMSRAIYKGILKFLSDLYCRSYVVQPLPVRSLAVTSGSSSSEAQVSWKESEDKLEPTAKAKGFILYTRVDDGEFDGGQKISYVTLEDGRCSTTVPVEPGHIYSFKVVAFNDGGRSFPSETLCMGSPASGSKGKVAVVNNFYRISAPTWFDTPSYAGFEGSIDSGVPYMYDISYIGENYEHRRGKEYESDSNPGFGATMGDMAGSVLQGNTFDFAYVHGRALMNAGYSFISASEESWSADASLSDGCCAADLICGKQVSTMIGNGCYGPRFRVFSDGLQARIKDYTSKGGNIIISGAYIGTDAFDQIYPLKGDEAYRTQASAFVESTLGYKLDTSYGTHTGMLAPARNGAIDLRGRLKDAAYCHEYGASIYKVDNSDALKISGKHTCCFLKYADTQLNAAICYNPGQYKTVCFGFPLETLKNKEDIDILLANALQYFSK